MKKIWVYIEHRDGEAARHSVGLAAEARRLAEGRACAVDAVAFGRVETPLPADRMFEIEDDPRWEEFPSARSGIIVELVRRHKPDLFLFPDTPESRSAAARVAAAADAAFAPGCTALRYGNGGGLLAVRGTHGGKFSQTIEIESGRAAVVTVPPESAVPPAGTPAGQKPEVTPVAPAVAPEDVRIRLVRAAEAGAEEMDLAEAPVIVSGGRGLKAKENFSLIEELAGLLGGVAAGTRGAVERGWIDSGRQVGQTGKTVAPELYIACGLSGAPQHLLGMKNSRLIAAVNTDPHAPIMRVADFAVIGDLFQIVPALIGMLAGKSKP